MNYELIAKMKDIERVKSHYKTSLGSVHKMQDKVLISF